MSKLISIRLNEEMIDDLKKISNLSCIKYQSLIKNALEKFINDEYRKIALEHIEKSQK